MLCPNCRIQMRANTFMTKDQKQIGTTHLCDRCLKRALSYAPNPRYVPIQQTEMRTVVKRQHADETGYPGGNGQ